MLVDYNITAGLVAPGHQVGAAVPMICTMLPKYDVGVSVVPTAALVSQNTANPRRRRTDLSLRSSEENLNIQQKEVIFYRLSNCRE